MSDFAHLNDAASNERRSLLLVRHGLPDYRLRKRTDEAPGPGLTHVGRRQAEQAAERVASLTPSAIYTSPLLRALETARIVAKPLGLTPCIECDLSEWRRTEKLHQVTIRSARWLRRWLVSGERCAVAVGHASPLLALVREALFLPHKTWWHPRRPHMARLDSADRLDCSLASVIEVSFERGRVTARCLLNPLPHITYVRPGVHMRRSPYPGGARPASACTRRILSLCDADPATRC
jgi:broad specificity phosphatase PhoE